MNKYSRIRSENRVDIQTSFNEKKSLAEIARKI